MSYSYIRRLSGGGEILVLGAYPRMCAGEIEHLCFARVIRFSKFLLWLEQILVRASPGVWRFSTLSIRRRQEKGDGDREMG